MERSFLVLFISILLGALDVSAQDQHQQDQRKLTKKLDEYLLSAFNSYHLNGSALIASHGKILLHKAYGWRNIEQGALNDTSTNFPILSMTKSFTSTVVLKLQEEGKLSLKDKLSKYFPDYSRANDISLRELLNHTSGINNYTDPIGIEDSSIVCNPVTRQQVLDLFYTKPQETEPGKEFNYNNSAYYLLGMIIEKVTGQPYEKIVREMILSPLGMSNSGFDFNGLPPAKKATGYYLFNEEKKQSICWLDSTVSYAAGALYSTTGDIYRWARAVANKQILSEKSWNSALKPGLGNYGYGWWIRSLYNKKFYYHSGGYPGYMSTLAYFPVEDLTIILLNNFGTYDQNIWAITIGLTAISLNLPYDNWTVRKEVPQEEVSLKKFIGEYALNNKTSISISIKEGRLFGIGKQGTDMPELALFADSSNTFFLKDFNTTFRFVNNDQGDVNKLIVHEHGKDTEWKKL
jgi:CubicO group peptidase (beta-lactamase class C family)